MDLARSTRRYYISQSSQFQHDSHLQQQKLESNESTVMEVQVPTIGSLKSTKKVQDDRINDAEQRILSLATRQAELSSIIAT